jgi:RNA polymerase sigma-70 factor (ECF subfamily)
LSTAKSKQARWFVEEVQPHESSLRAYLRAVFPSLPDLDDLVQETYLRLIRAQESGRVNYAKAFLFTTARNTAIDFFRRRKIVSFEAVGDFHHW